MITECVVKSADKTRTPTSFTYLTLWKKILVEALDTNLGWQKDAGLWLQDQLKREDCRHQKIRALSSEQLTGINGLLYLRGK